MPPLRYDWAYAAQARAARPAGRSSTAASRRRTKRPRTWRTPTARCSAAPRTTTPTCCIASTSRGSAASCARARELLRALRPYVEAQLARGVYLKHITRHLLGLFARRARRPRVPPGAERRRAQARRRLVAGRARAGADRIARQSAARGRRRMITRDIAAFLAHRPRARPRTSARPTARAAFLVAPDGFRLAEQSAADNRYMADAAALRCRARVGAAPRRCSARLSQVLPTVCFAGDPDDARCAVPQQRVRDRAPGRYVVGRMRHPVRQREADARRHPRVLRRRARLRRDRPVDAAASRAN